MSENQSWTPCQRPMVGNILKWNEPLWAKPNKPRGKPDKIGEQQVIAELTNLGDLLELTVVEVTKLSGDDAVLKVKEGDKIRRKKSSLDQGACHRRLD